MNKKTGTQLTEPSMKELIALMRKNAGKPDPKLAMNVKQARAIFEKHRKMAMT